MKKRILIIEDNEKNRKLEKLLFEIADFDVLEAADAARGLALAREEIPDLIIMDMRLPDMRGIELAGILRRDGVTAGIPIVFVTASAIVEEMEKIKSSADYGYITKPINTRTFVDEVCKYIM